MKTTKARFQATRKTRWSKSCIKTSRSSSACGMVWHWDDNKGGSLDPELCAKARQEEVEYIRRHKMYTRVSREECLRETGRSPIKTGWAETDKGQPGKPNVRARWVAKESKTHARPELYASTPPLEALKVVLSEIATGKSGEKVVALVDVPRAYCYAPARLDALSIPLCVIKKGRPHGARHGKTDAQKEHFVAHKMLLRCIKKNYDGIHDRFQRDPENRDSKLKIGWTEEKCIAMDKFAQEEDHSYPMRNMRDIRKIGISH